MAFLEKFYQCVTKMRQKKESNQNKLEK